VQMERREEAVGEFTTISSEQKYYLNEEGFLVVVFPAGSLTDEETWFIIPSEVFSAQ